MLKKPLGIVLFDEQIEATIIDHVIKDAVNTAIGVDIGKEIEISVSRIEYGYYVGWLGEGKENAAETFIRNVSDEIELHGLHFERLSFPNPVDVHAHFNVTGNLS